MKKGYTVLINEMISATLGINRPFPCGPGRPSDMPQKQAHFSHAFILILISIILSTAMLPTNLSAEIYSYVDENGIMHFSNVPTSPHYRYYSSESRLEPADIYKDGGIHRYDHFIRRAAERYGVPFGLLKAIIQVESNFNPAAVSQSGALGLMQIMPANVELFNLNDPFDPEENIMAGARYLRILMKKFGDVELCLAAYNAGPAAVEHYNRVPPFPETENYVNKVLKYYAAFQSSAN